MGEADETLTGAEVIVIVLVLVETEETDTVLADAELTFARLVKVVLTPAGDRALTPLPAW